MRIISCLVVTLTVWLQPSAHAALGENLNTSPQPLIARQNIIQRGSLRVRETRNPKLQLREIADSDGEIFAVSWNGKTHPVMSEIMGNEYPQFAAALTEARKHHHGHGPLAIEHGNFHLELGGSMRAVVGRAWLINRIPAGVKTNEIR